MADLNNLQAVITTAQNAYQSTKATHAAAIAAAAAAATDNSAKLAALDKAQADFDEAIASVRVHLIPDPDSTWGKTK